MVMLQARMESPMSLLSQPLVLLTRRIAAEENGATAIEYALIAAGVGAAVAATVYSLGTSLNGLYQSVAAAL